MCVCYGVKNHALFSMDIFMQEENKTESRTHAVRSMSRWPAVIDCQCFESKEFTQAAQKGTDTHALLAGWLTAYKHTGTLPEMPPDLDFVEQGAYRCARDIVAQSTAQGCAYCDLDIEAKVRIADTNIHGYVDALWFNGGIEEPKGITIFDFKTFRNPSRDYTAQLAGYAVAACRDRFGEDYPVTLVIGYGDYNKYDVQQVTLKDCCEWYRKAMESFDKRDSGEAEPKQCAWCELCKHSATCPAFKAIATKVAQEPTLKNAPESWGELSTPRKAQLLVLAETVAKWAEQVRDKAKEDLLNGAVIEDSANAIKYGLRQTKGRKIPRTEDACRMLKDNGATDSELRAVLKIGATECKAVLKEHGIKGKKADELIDNVCDFSTPTSIMVRL